MRAEPEKQILVAGIGNSWLRDDAFGEECARRLAERGVPSGVTVLEFGTGGLDLAYEIMRGYDALILLDASSHGEEPGTLYVIEPDLDEHDSGIEDGNAINPHGMDPATVLRFVKVVGGFTGKVVVIGCEPGDVSDIGMGLSPPVEAAMERALDLVAKTIDELRTDAAYQR